MNSNVNNSTKYKIISLNVNSIISNYKRIQLSELLKKKNPNFVLINETKLNKHHTIYYKNYKIARDDRTIGVRGGGTAILTKNNIKFNHIHSDSENSLLEKTIIQINLGNSKKLFIISIYAKKGNQDNFISELTQIFKNLNLNNPANYYILAGDFNAKHISWHNSENNDRGIRLKNWIDNNDITYKLKLYGTDSPTFPKNRSFIDLVLADTRINLLTNSSNNINTISFDSDHKALSFRFEIENNELEISSTSKEQKFNYNKADWKKFQNTLTQKINEIPNNRNLSLEEINTYINTLDNNILESMEISIPKNKQTNSTDKYISHRYKKLKKYKSYILTSIHRLEKQKRLHPLDPYPITDLIRLKKLKNNIKNEMIKEITNTMNNFWENRISNVSTNNSKVMFPEINRIFRNKKQNELPPLLVPKNKENLLVLANINKNTANKDSKNNYIIYELEQKLNLLAAHFASINNQNKNMGKARLNEIIERDTNIIENEILADSITHKTICNFNNDNPSHMPTEHHITQNYFTNVIETTKKFKKLNNKKSSGIDNIPNLVLKHLPPKIIYNYTIIFNNMINLSYFPPKWKEAKIIALPKKTKILTPR